MNDSALLFGGLLAGLGLFSIAVIAWVSTRDIRRQRALQRKRRSDRHKRRDRAETAESADLAKSPE